MSDEDLTALCVDCGIETLPVDEGRAEWYHVETEVWEQTGLGIDDGCLCVGCIEKRLGRKLTAADFSTARVNDLTNADNPRYAWSYRTPRLVDRLGNK